MRHRECPSARVIVATGINRHQFLRFLDEIDANLPSGFDVHLIIDNYGVHKARPGAAVGCGPTQAANQNTAFLEALMHPASVRSASW